MNDSHSPRSPRNPRDSRSKPSYRDRRPPAGRPRSAPKKNLFVNKSPREAAKVGFPRGWS